MRIRIFITLCLATFALPAIARAAQSYLVTDGAGSNIWRLEDRNGDDDALDVGERTQWASGFSSVGAMESWAGSIYAIDTTLGVGGEVVRLTDTNRDGDTFDIGERIVWAAGFDQPVDIASGANGVFYVSEFSGDVVWRLEDFNSDGDALDVGERSLFADAISSPSTLLPWGDDLLVTANLSRDVMWLRYTNGDHDALDAFERVSVLTDINLASGLLDDGLGALYVTSFLDNAVYHATDHNGDGDFFDSVELLRYADSVYGSLDGPIRMVNYAGGGFLLTDFSDGEVAWVRDINGDGDALDLGEVVRFADGFDQPADIVALQDGLPGDYNHNGTVDAADYVIWRMGLGTTFTQQDYDIWRDHFGETAGGAGSAAAVSPTHLPVPEPGAAAILLVASLVIATFDGASIRRANGCSAA